jgi:hypothetical protein
MAGVVSGDQLPHSGTASLLAAHAVVTTTVAPCAGALVQTPAGSTTSVPLSVQSPWLKTTQHPLALQTPAPPTGN